MNAITALKPLLDFSLELTYKEGEVVVVDFKPAITQEGVFSIERPAIFPAGHNRRTRALH